MTERRQFRVSSYLKNLIGRDLITDDFVAVFELVKNSFDAHARHVRITFDDDAVIIADDGKGMSHADILDKWLFVAYSAKRDGTEDEDYRDRVRERGKPFAGAKGVGRFSCDRLGAELTLVSKARGQPAQILEVDWRLYEADARKEFGQIRVRLDEEPDFPDRSIKLRAATGTILQIRALRSEWDRSRLQELKRELAKLVDPFGIGQSRFQIEVVAPAELEADRADAAFNEARKDGQNERAIVNGTIENRILDALGERTTAITVKLSDDGTELETALIDRGDLIYRISERNPYDGLSESEFHADVYFLNRSAKATFARRMGLPVIQFGSVFMFRNGFRVFPIGADGDDFFGLNHRKQQGQRRFLGGRDLIGRVDVAGVTGFDEATSRNQGLIRTHQVEQLIECFRDKCVKRLERYVVDITWRDRFDKDVDDTSRMMLDESSARVAQLVSRLAATEGVQLLEYNPDIVRIVDEKSSAFESSLSALEMLAEETGDPRLLSSVTSARERMRNLELAEAEAREAESRAESRAQRAEAAASAAQYQVTQERERNQFLVAASSLDQDTILNLHHQIIIHAADVHHGVKRMMGRIRTNDLISTDEWVAFLESTSYRNSQILTAARFATKGGYKQQAAAIKADIVGYIRDYVETIATLWAPRNLKIEVRAGDGVAVKFERSFKPIEIGIVIDNLISNAKKAHAKNIHIDIAIDQSDKSMLVLHVSDDGDGWPSSLGSPSRAFEKGVTTTDGSGLGLAHVKQVVEGMGGAVSVLNAQDTDAFEGAHISIRLPK